MGERHQVEVDGRWLIWAEINEDLTDEIADCALGPHLTQLADSARQAVMI